MDDPDVVEIPPPLHQNLPKRIKKEKQSVYHDVIDADEDLVVLGETSRKRSRAKPVETIQWDHKPGTVKSETISGIRSSNGLKDTGNSTLQPNNTKIQGSIMGSSSLKIKTDNADQFSGSQRFGPEFSNSSSVESSKSRRFRRSVNSLATSSVFDSKKKILAGYLDEMKLPHGGKLPHLGQLESAKQGVASRSSFHSNFVGRSGSLHPKGIGFGNTRSNSYYNFGARPEHSHGKPSVLNSAREFGNPVLNSYYNSGAPPAHSHGDTSVLNSSGEFGNPWLNNYYNFGAPPAYSHGNTSLLNSAGEFGNPWLSSYYNFGAPSAHSLGNTGLLNSSGEFGNPWLNSFNNFGAPLAHSLGNTSLLNSAGEFGNPWLNSFDNIGAPLVHSHGNTSLLNSAGEFGNPWLNSFDNIGAPLAHSHGNTSLLNSAGEFGNSWLNSYYNYGVPLAHSHGNTNLLNSPGEFVNPWLNSYDNIGAPPEHSHSNTSVLNSGKVGQNEASVVTPGLTTMSNELVKETLRKLQSFKQFDTVIDTSDHHFVNHISSMNHNPKSWAKKIQEEWKILEKNLPDTIFVRVYESRMDLLRAAIVGAEGTPYHDGLFFFDIHFPSDYPNVPPLVHYRSGGLHLNPNLYACGKVCLSLLNTWFGSQDEMWTPGVSTILQVLVSIQGLILNANPYFNEPGIAIASMSGSKGFDVESLMYNENTFILSLRTMMYMIKNPPKNFEDLVVGHFYNRAHDILASCKAYMEDVRVGCFVKGEVKDAAKDGGTSSYNFKTGLFECVKLLVHEFEKIGVKDCRKFMSPIHQKPTLPKMTMNPTLKPTSLKLPMHSTLKPTALTLGTTRSIK